MELTQFRVNHGLGAVDFLKFSVKPQPLKSCFQAKNPDQVISAFNKFCRATVNEEEEIAHKLLGKQFQVMDSLPSNKCSNYVSI